MKISEKIRKKLLNLDYKIYLLKWKQEILLCTELLKTEKNLKERDKLMARKIYEPFSSIYQSPVPDIITLLTEK